MLECESIDAVHAHAIDALLNDLSRQSPADFAESLNKFTGINLFECGAFHRYLEIKATRDVYIHNRGIANKQYVAKAGQHARVKAGLFLPIDLRYFSESFEQSVQFSEWLEEQLHDKWHSSEFEKRKNSPRVAPVGEITPPTDAISEELRALAVTLAGSPALTDESSGKK